MRKLAIAMLRLEIGRGVLIVGLLVWDFCSIRFQAAFHRLSSRLLPKCKLLIDMINLSTYADYYADQSLPI